MRVDSGVRMGDQPTRPSLARQALGTGGTLEAASTTGGGPGAEVDTLADTARMPPVSMGVAFRRLREGSRSSGAGMNNHQGAGGTMPARAVSLGQIKAISNGFMGQAHPALGFMREPLTLRVSLPGDLEGVVAGEARRNTLGSTGTHITSRIVADSMLAGGNASLDFLHSCPFFSRF